MTKNTFASSYERKTAQALVRLKMKYQTQYYLSLCKCCPYDFYVPKWHTLIEVQGEQHFKFTPAFHDSQQDFQRRLSIDKYKISCAQRSGFNLIHINYWEIDKVYELLKTYKDITIAPKQTRLKRLMDWLARKG